MIHQKSILFLCALFISFACGKKKDEPIVAETNVLDTTQFRQVDSIAVSTRRTIPDTILTIAADTVRALYYPNTGREVMKLVKGDVCKITRSGRYDIIDGKGNFWVRVERFGGKGWIFGGQTSLKSDVWVFSEGITELGHPYIKYKLNKLSAPVFDDLFSLVGETIENTKYAVGEDEAGTRSVDANDDEILVEEDDDAGSITKERFKPGPTIDSLYSINYLYNLESTNNVSFNHTLITFPGRPKNSFVADFAGELQNIYKVGKNYLFVADYVLTGTELGKVHYANLVVWSPQKKGIISRQRLGYSAVDVEGFPIFKHWDDGSFISDTKCTFTQTEGVVNLEVFEIYSRINDAGKVEDKVFYITRYFTFNENTNHFVESKQEVMYLAK